MGLLTIIRKTKQKEKRIRLLLLGLDNAGKSTVLKRFLGGDVRQISPTVGFDIQSTEYQGFNLNLWDIGGQTSIRAYWRNYFEETDGLIFVVDAADKRRLLECKEELFKLLTQEKLAGASLLILANKQDIDGALKKEDIATVLDLQNAIFRKRHCQIVGCSAITGDGVEEGFQWAVQDIGSRLYLLS